MHVIADSLLTEYDAYGEDDLPVVLLLHGWGDSAAGWKDFAQKLSGSYRVVVPSLPGFGGTQQPKSPWGLTDYALYVAAFVKKLQLKPHVIIGHSNGGAIAIRMLARGFLSTDKLVLLASAGIRTSDKSRKTVLNVVAKMGKIVAVPLPDKMRNRLRRKLYNMAGSDLLFAEHMQETFKRVVKDDVQDDAKLISVPTLLVYGKNDDATPVVFGEQFNELIKDSRLEIIPDNGHFLHRDEPDKVRKIIEGFIS